MGESHAISRAGDALTMGAALDVLTHRTPGGILHRDPFVCGAFTQRRLLVVGQSKGHGHPAMVSE